MTTIINGEFSALLVAAVSIAFIHTILGPDHYIPFVAMSRARGWSRTRTVVITLACGLGHVGSSVVLGLIGVAFGVTLANIEAIESFRGDLAAWGLTAFGLIYLLWGLRRARRKMSHTHSHSHGEGGKSGWQTPWTLFIIFVLGPCEPLIPILMYPAALRHTEAAVVVAAVFSIVTLATMVAAVLVLSYGIRPIRIRWLERYAHAVAGFAILLCGTAIHLGL